MKQLLRELQQRNAVLYWFGWLMLLGGLISVLMTTVDKTIILGINAWIKPAKFYFSVWIFSWTMTWLAAYLKQQKKVSTYAWGVVTLLGFEMVVITWQAANGRLSHFNNSTPLYAILFALMGLAITVLVIWTAYIGLLFLKQKEFSIPKSYVWGIRLGIIFFVIFSFEGGIMASNLAHTVGAADGGPGLPVVNWSRQYGDLRVAHFMGMHSLQLLPLFGYFVAKTNKGIFIFSTIYFLVVILLLVQALMAKPLFF